MDHMFARQSTFTPISAPPVAKQAGVNLEELSRETGVPVDMLRTLAGISNPNNAHMFTAEAARKAFAGVKVRHEHA